MTPKTMAISLTGSATLNADGTVSVDLLGGYPADKSELTFEVKCNADTVAMMANPAVAGLFATIFGAAFNRVPPVVAAS